MKKKIVLIVIYSLILIVAVSAVKMLRLYRDIDNPSPTSAIADCGDPHIPVGGGE